MEEHSSVSSTADPFGLRSRSASKPQTNSSTGKPPLNQRRLTEETASVTQYEDAFVPKLAPLSASSEESSPNGVQAGFPMSTSSPDAAMRRLNLSHISPQQTVFSQLSADDEDDGDVVHDHHKLTRTSRPRRSTLTAASVVTTSTLLLQKQLTELQSQLDMALQQRTTAVSELNQTKRTLTQLQTERDDLKRRLEAKDADTHLQQKQQELELWQEQLQEEARTLDDKRQQASRQQQDWLELQNALQESELAQQQEHQRLVDWSAELERLEHSLENQKQDLQEQRQEQKERVQQDRDKLVDQERRLNEWQRRLQEETETLRARSKQMLQQETKIRTAQTKLQQDNADIQSALDELEARNQSYEAKYELIEQAVEELTLKRQDEEEKLEAALQQRRDVAAQAEQIIADSEQVKSALQEKIELAQAQLVTIQDEIGDKRHELESLQEKIQNFVEKDHDSRRKAMKEAERAAEELKAVQDEKTHLVEQVAKLEEKCERIVEHIKQREEEWKLRHQSLVEEEQITISEMKLDADRETQSMVQAARDHIAKLAQAQMESMEKSAKELDDGFEKIEAMQSKLANTVMQYENEYQKLIRDQQACESLRAELNEKISNFVASEGREKRLREELEWEVERLQSLLRTERANSDKRAKDVEADMERLREQNQDELLSLAQRLEAIESERDGAFSDIEKLRALLSERDNELRELRDTLANEKSALEKELSAALWDAKRFREQAVELEIEKSQLKSELEVAIRKANLAQAQVNSFRKMMAEESKEKEKAEQLLQRLELHSVELDEREAKCRDEMRRAQELAEEASTRLKSVDQKVSEMPFRTEQGSCMHTHLS